MNQNAEILQQEGYAEAQRYMSNAQESLLKADREDNYYADPKYVRTACGTAYSGVLLALDALLQCRGVEMPKKKRRSIEFYTAHVARLDGRLLRELNTAYSVLHLLGYYDGERNANVIKGGFEAAYSIIERIRPRSPISAEEWAERRRSRYSPLRRAYMAMFM